MTSKLFAIFVSGLLGALMFPTVLWGHHLPDLGWFAWFYLVPLFLSLDRSHGPFVFWGPFFANFIIHLGALYWLVPAMVEFGEMAIWASVAVLILINGILSLYFSCALGFARWVGVRIPIPHFLLIAIFLISFDVLRSTFPVEGFPWTLPAYSQGGTLPYFQWLDLTGVMGLNFLIYLVNGLIAEMIIGLIHRHEERSMNHAVNRTLILFFLILASVGGSLYQSKKAWPSGPTQMVGLLQGNVAQVQKWDGVRASFHLDKYEELTREAADGGAQIAVWPESAYPFTIILEEMEKLHFTDSEMLAIPAIIGSVAQTGETFFNSAFRVGTSAIGAEAYHKRHLVPFGEYIPMKPWLPFANKLVTAGGDFFPGMGQSTLSFGEVPFGILICYEDLFPELSRKSVEDGAGLLINLTNDAWYGNTSAQYQHVVFSQFRALENRRYVLRATNTGITAAINDRGAIVEQLPPFEEGILVASAPVILGKTFYQRHGEWLAWAMVVLALGLVFVRILLAGIRR